MRNINMNKVFEYDCEVITHRTINTEEIEGTDFVFYEDVREIVQNGNFCTEVYKGVTSKENINSVIGLGDIENIVKAPRMYEKKAIVAAINKDNYQKVMNGDMYIEDAIEHLKNIDYSKNKYVLILWSWLSNKIADLDYNFISIPIHLGYMNGFVDNSKYDLNQLLEKLKNDERVCHRENLKITDIPYYDRDYEERRTKQIEFSYLLTDKEYDDIANINPTFKSSQYILDNIIGAKECEKSYECAK